MKSFFTSRKNLLIGLILVLLILLLLWIAKPRSAVDVASAVTAASNSAALPEAATPTRPRATLSVQTVKPRMVAQLAQYVAANGEVIPWQESVIGSELVGLRIKSIPVTLGQFVSAGQTLIELEDSMLRAELEQASANLAVVKASASEAQSNAERARELEKEGLMSPQVVQQNLTSEAVAQARVLQAQAQLTGAKVRLAQTIIKAPDSGEISSLTSAVGNVVGGGELIRLVRQGRLEWRAQLTADEIPKIKAGMTVEIKASNGAQTQGRVRVIAPALDAQKRLAAVYVSLQLDARARQQIKAGMFASGRFVTALKGGVVIPSSAVLLRDGRYDVFVLQADQTVKQQRIEVGQRLGDEIEVLSGLASTQAIVKSGTAFLADGDTVKVLP